MVKPIRTYLNSRWIHSFLGLWCSIILFVIFLTGTLSVLGTEIDWLFTKEMRVSSEGREKLELPLVFDAAQAAKPGRPLVRVYRHDESWIADQVGYLTLEGKTRQIWVDPYSGEVTGETSTQRFAETIGAFHSHFFIPTKIGIMTVSVFSLALTGSLIAGILLLPRFWKSFVIRPRFRSNARALSSDIHRLVGAWSIPFLALITLSALYYFAETLKLAAPRYDIGSGTQRRDLHLREDFSGDHLAGLIAQAHSVYPELKIKTIILPRNQFQPIRIDGDMSATLVRERANAVYFHPETLEMRLSHKGEDLSVHQRISEAVDPLHWGYWGGLWSKIVWFFFGLLAMSLPALGAIIFAKRMGVRRSKLEGRELSGWRVYWDGLGPAKWASFALVGVALLLMMYTLLLG